MTLYKVEVGSARYKEGIRWTECIKAFFHGKAETTEMVLDYIYAHPDVIIIISQDLGEPHHKKTEYIKQQFDYPLCIVEVYLTGAWSHELRQECRARRRHETTQHGGGDNQLLTKGCKKPFE